jgi:hypothetical protein
MKIHGAARNDSGNDAGNPEITPGESLRFPVALGKASVKKTKASGKKIDAYL